MGMQWLVAMMERDGNASANNAPTGQQSRGMDASRTLCRSWRKTRLYIFIRGTSDLHLGIGNTLYRFVTKMQHKMK